MLQLHRDAAKAPANTVDIVLVVHDVTATLCDKRLGRKGKAAVQADLKSLLKTATTDGKKAKLSTFFEVGRASWLWPPTH